jgi:hypothetical protein
VTVEWSGLSPSADASLTTLDLENMLMDSLFDERYGRHGPRFEDSELAKIYFNVENEGVVHGDAAE